MSNGTTDYQTFCAQIADYANRQDWSQALLDGFVAMASQKLNAELRIDRMISSAQNTVTAGCAALPDDWLESDFMLMAADSATGWVPIHYKPREEFFRQPLTPSTYYPPNQNTTYGFYTIQGRTLFFGGPVDAVEGTTFQLNYYAEVPVFSDTQSSWVYTKYPSLYLSAAMMNAFLHAVGEEDKAAASKQLTEDTIQTLNAAHRYARASGSRLARGRRRAG